MISSLSQTAASILAEFAADLDLYRLKAETIGKAKFAILDAIGCGIAGAVDPAVNVLCRTLSEIGETGKMPIWGRPDLFSPKAAALINGAMIHALEMDDTHSFSSVHAGGPVVASSLSACSLYPVSGPKLIEAVIAGYDISCRLGMAIRGKSPYHRGFHPTGICGVFGAATASGKIIGLDVPGYLNAWGIAGSMAGGLMAYLQNGAWTKKMHPGWASQSGLLASLLARGGYTGPQDIFGGKYNFCGAYADMFDPDALTDEIGSRYEINRMSYKRFACCRTIHAPITAALKLRLIPGFRPEAVEEIRAFIADEDLDLVVEPLEKKKHPGTPVEAQFSMPFGVALALAEGDAMPSQFTQEKLNNPLIKFLTEKFQYVVNDDFTKRRPLYFPCELRIRIRGDWHTASVDAPVGDYTSPLSSDQMKEKFHRLCDHSLGMEKAQRLEQRILSFEGEGDTRALIPLIFDR